MSILTITSNFAKISTSLPSSSTMGSALTLLSRNLSNAAIMVVSSVAVSTFSKVPILNSANDLLRKLGRGRSFILKLEHNKL